MHMEPFYFGPPDRALFGLFHPSSTNNSRRTGLVICSPIGPEYFRTYRIMSVLAGLLAERGFDVLRFDYHGCGDSPGDSKGSDLGRWRGDIAAAVEEMEKGCAPDRIWLLGLRLGASLASLESERLRQVESTILWAPVLKGGEFSVELKPYRKARSDSELLALETWGGMVLDAKAADEIATLDLLSGAGGFHGETVLVDLPPEDVRLVARRIEPGESAVGKIDSRCGPFWFEITVVVPRAELTEVADRLVQYHG